MRENRSLRRCWQRRLVIATAFGLTVSLPMPSLATDEVIRGADDYRTYCSACHGLRADGQGPVANVLRPRPPALTDLDKARYGRPLGTSLVAYIMGDTMPRAHGQSDMPVWGKNLEDADGRDKEAISTMWRVVNYLDEIQESR